MDVKEAYTLVGGNYENARGRLLSDERIRKYLLKFASSSQSTQIEKAISDGDRDTAFREAHNLKGVCANLGLDMLCASAGALVDALRRGDADVTPLLDAMCRDFDAVVSALCQLTDD